jgi:hypothetical protein
VLPTIIVRYAKKYAQRRRRASAIGPVHAGEGPGAFALVRERTGHPGSILATDHLRPKVTSRWPVCP